MLVDISLLISNVVDSVTFDEEVTFDKEMLDKVGLLDLNARAKGKITKNSIDTLSMDICISGDMYLPCAITLKPVKNKFNIVINDEKIYENENILRKDENTLELKPFLWENIVVEIPLRVVSDDAYDKEYKGSGWQLISDDNYVKPNKALSSLTEMFKDKEE